MRTTKKQVESAFKALISEMGGRIACGYNDVGGYLLDYAACYGGYQIARICSESGGQSCPFGYKRSSASEMYEKLWFTVEVLRVRALDAVVKIA